MKFSRITGLLLLVTLSTRIEADTKCPRTESGRAKIDWLYGIPKPEALPPIQMVAKEGAYVLLDERVFNGLESIYSLIVMVGDKESFDAFGNVEVQTGFDQFADIKARVQSPDGKVTELGADDIQCSTMDFQNIGYNIGKSKVPRQYVFHFPILVPGALLHYQINIRDHRRTKPYWLLNYTNLFYIRLGSQGGLGYFPDNNVQPRDRYPGNQISYILNLPVGLKYTTGVFPAGAAVDIKEIPSKESSYDRLLRISARRSSLPYEPYEPFFGTDTPEVAVFVNSTTLSPVSEPDFGIKDWKEWVNRFVSDHIANTKPHSESLASVFRDSQISADVPRRRMAEMINRFMRDKVANSAGFEIRNAFGHRPPIDVVAKSKTATRLDKTLVLISLLKAAGIDARMVYTRSAGLKPIDKSFPMGDWFGINYLVSAEFEGTRVYFDPIHKLASGAIMESLQGGEALVIKDRSTWEWSTLPLSTAAENLSRAELAITGREGASLKGKLELKITGVEADRIRNNRDLSPASLTRYFTSVLEYAGLQGTTFSGVTHENFADPDLPIIVRADFEAANAARKLGAKTLLRILPMRLGPVSSTFGADVRVQDVDFHIPRRFEIAIRLPAAIAAVAAPPETVKVSGPGLDYERSYLKDAEGLTLTRRVSLHDRVPVSQYGELKKTLSKLDDADGIDLLLEK